MPKAKNLKTLGVVTMMNETNNLLIKYVPQKYQKCIKDFYKDIDGYWIELKNDYKSTTTDTETIHEFTIQDTRKQLQTIVYNISNVDVPVKSKIKVHEPLEAFKTTWHLTEDETLELANEEVKYTNYPNTQFEKISEAIEFLIKYDFIVNETKFCFVKLDEWLATIQNGGEA
jgi:hypothetical protein